ncbi:MAG: response regulator, partial [Planctomycetota bacterium]
MNRESRDPGEAGREGTVLVVDDESAVRRIARRILEEAGHAVLEAGNGREALEIFAENDAPISLILLDSSMPEMQGAELIARLRERGSRVPIVFCS